MLSREIIEKTEVFLKRKFDAADYLNAHPEAGILQKASCKVA